MKYAAARSQQGSSTGETVTGRLIMQNAAQNLIPSTTELGGKSPNIFFADLMDHDDEFLDQAIAGLVRSTRAKCAPHPAEH